jgi:hypothetical protein
MPALAHLPAERCGVMNAHDPATATPMTNPATAIDWSFGSRGARAAYAHLRAALPRGTHVMTTAARLARGSLAGFDALVLTPFTGAALDAEELAVVEDFVRRGGALFAFYNEAPRDLAALFGATAPGVPSDSGAAHIVDSPLASGPGGTLAGEVAIGWAPTFSSLGENGFAVLDADVVEGDAMVVSATVGAAFEHGNGRAVIIGDEEIFSSVGTPGMASAMASDVSTAFFRNALAWLVRTSR